RRVARLRMERTIAMQGFITDPKVPGGLRLADDLPDPSPADGEALVEVRAYSVNRGELFLLKMRPDGWRPGQDLAGVVVRAASDGSRPAAGTRIAGLVDWECWAERVAVPSHLAVPLPTGVTFEQGASLPIAGITALRAARLGGSLLGRRVLITGATGGVGQFAIQLTAAAGAHVTAFVAGPERETEAKALGSHEVITTLDDGHPGTFDFVLDGIGGQVLTDAVHRLTPGGVAVTYGTLGGPAPLALHDFPRGDSCRVIPLFHGYPLETRGDDLAALIGLVADGRLEPLLGMVRDWKETLTVLEALRERRVRGKAVLTRQAGMSPG
ncbi:MAG: zinc-binding dehydrogenase, partial [bacterium]